MRVCYPLLSLRRQHITLNVNKYDLTIKYPINKTQKHHSQKSLITPYTDIQSKLTKMSRLTQFFSIHLKISGIHDRTGKLQTAMPDIIQNEHPHYTELFPDDRT